MSTLKPAGVALQVLFLTTFSVFGTSARAQITWYFDGSASVPPSIRNQITASMDEAVAHYNAYSLYEWSDYAPTPQGIRVIYDPNVPTANAGYKSRISFGGSRGVSTALHEMGHVFGVGTYEPIWTNLLSGGQWQGNNGNAELQRYNGPGAIINGDGSHFWPYGLNFSTEDSPEARLRHVRVIGAMRSDMRLFNGNGTEVLGDYNNDGVTDAADYTVWRDRNGDTTSLVNDQTIGGVDESDYLWWDRGYGRTLASTHSISTPEPTGLALGLAGVAMLTCLPKARKHQGDEA